MIKNVAQRREIDIAEKETYDFLVICSDVGVCGYKGDDERATITTLRELPVTTLFCDGNHENFDKLSAYQEEEYNILYVWWGRIQ